MINKLAVTVTKTSDGKSEYIQILSDDQITVNVVVIARKIDLSDCRKS